MNNEEKNFDISFVQPHRERTFPAKDIRDQDGLKSDIYKLATAVADLRPRVTHGYMARAEEETHFKMALQHILDEHDHPVLKDLLKQIRSLQDMNHQALNSLENHKEALELAVAIINRRSPKGFEQDIIYRVVEHGVEALKEEDMEWYQQVTQNEEEE